MCVGVKETSRKHGVSDMKWDGIVHVSLSRGDFEETWSASRMKWDRIVHISSG